MDPNTSYVFKYVWQYLHHGPFLAVFHDFADFHAYRSANGYRGYPRDHTQLLELKVSTPHVVVIEGHEPDGPMVYEFMNSYGSAWGYESRGFVLASLDYRELIILINQ